MRLLLVEDHVPLADELLASLIRQGYAVDWLADGRDGTGTGRAAGQTRRVHAECGGPPACSTS